VSPVKYEMGFYIPEGDILHSHCREDLKSDNNMINFQVIFFHAKACVDLLRLL
jgi:hypothetical protein